MDENPIGYNEYAAEFADRAALSVFNALYDRPAVLEVAGDVADLHVLDLGCGPGLYAEELTTRGARVLGVDSSSRMVQLAQERLGSTAQFKVHDLNEELYWLADASFDLAIMALVIHHLVDRNRVLREAHRVLRPRGRLVVSTHHPTSDWYRLGGSYFDTERVQEVWHDKLGVEYWRQPLQTTCDEFTTAGFLIERIHEPHPSEELRKRSEGDYIKLSQLPGFIVFSLLKPS